MGHGGRSWSLSPVQWRCVGHLVGLLPPVLHCVLKMGRVLWGTGRGSPGEHCFVPTCHLSDVPRVLVTLQHISPNSANCNTCMQRWGSQEAEQSPPLLGRASPYCTIQAMLNPKAHPGGESPASPVHPPPPPKKKPTIQTNNGGKIPQPSSPCRAEHEALPSLGVPTRPAFRRSIAAATAADAQAERSAGHPRQPPPKKAKGLFPNPPPTHTLTHPSPYSFIIFNFFFFGLFKLLF